MRVQNPSTNAAQRSSSTPSSSSTTPSTKALPPSRPNELATPRQSDGFESPATRSRSSRNLLTGDSATQTLATPKPAANTINPKDIPAADWTVFVHLNADNNLEDFGKDDINEMEAGGGSVAGKLNMIALVDGGTRKDADGWNTSSRLMYVTRDPDNSNKLTSKEIEVDPSSDLGKLLAQGEIDSGSPEVLRAALDYVQRNTESKHYMVDLWDHGNGWKGISYDDNPSTSIDMPELQKALSGLPQKIDIVAADACLMATVEVADTAKAIGADYLVGSEELEPGTGWDYKDLLGRMNKLFAGKEPVTAEKMAKAIQESYVAGPRDNVTMSVTNLSKLDGLNSTLNDFSDALIQAGGLQDKTIRNAYEKALRMDDVDQMDLGDFARRVSNSTQDAALKAAADQLVAELAKTTEAQGAKGADAKWAAQTGLTIYAPKGGVDPQYKQAGSAWLNSHWNNVIKTYNASRVS